MKIIRMNWILWIKNHLASVCVYESYAEGLLPLGPVGSVQEPLGYDSETYEISMIRF
jgi:hypothetical protein